uniref:Transmembrane protein n=1 Tax=Amanita phalloides TaxID=67723 RepID=A0A5Q0N2E2_AMAPH|nr:hypothetical protein [Amanita phalloides]QFZ98665.1 hypothetical protein [Amanita phalloides]WLF85170.1 hypothetical protein [Amanita phalloides]
MITIKNLRKSNYIRMRNKIKKMISNFIISYYLLLKKYFCNYLELIIKFILLSEQLKFKYFFNKIYSFKVTAYFTFFNTKTPNKEKGKSKEGMVEIESFKERQIKLGKYLDITFFFFFFFTFTKDLIKLLSHKLIYGSYIVSKYKYFILFINFIYIFLIILDWFNDSTLSSDLLSKFAHIVSFQLINNLITKLIVIVTYIYNLEYTLDINISYINLTYINSLILFIVIHFIFLLIVIAYLFWLLKIKPLLDILFIQLLLKQFNLLKNLVNLLILILNLLNLELFEYFLSFNLNKIIFKNMIILSLANKDLVLTDHSQISEEDKIISCPALDKNLNSSLPESPTASEDEFLTPPYVEGDTVFTNFNELSKEDKITYLINKSDNKGMMATLYGISWLLEKILLDTDGTKHNVDLFIDNYLNQMLNLERDTQLKSKAFHRDKPFLRHLVHKTPLEYPYVIPINNNISEYDQFDLKEAIIKNEEEETFIEKQE